MSLYTGLQLPQLEHGPDAHALAGVVVMSGYLAGAMNCATASSGGDAEQFACVSYPCRALPPLYRRVDVQAHRGAAQCPRPALPRRC